MAVLRCLQEPLLHPVHVLQVRNSEDWLENRSPCPRRDAALELATKRLPYPHHRYEGLADHADALADHEHAGLEAPQEATAVQLEAPTPAAAVR